MQTEVLDTYAKIVEENISELDGVLETWSADMSPGEMEKNISSAEEFIRQSKDALHSARLEIHQIGNGVARKRKKREIDGYTKKYRALKRTNDEHRREWKKIQITGMSVESKRDHHYIQITEAGKAAGEADEQANLSYVELLEQKEKINSYENKLERIKQALNLSDTILGNMKVSLLLFIRRLRVCRK